MRKKEEKEDVLVFPFTLQFFWSSSRFLIIPKESRVDADCCGLNASVPPQILMLKPLKRWYLEVWLWGRD